MGQGRDLTSLARRHNKSDGWALIKPGLFAYKPSTLFTVPRCPTAPCLSAPEQNVCFNTDVANFSQKIRAHGILHVDQTPRWQFISPLFLSGDLPHPSFNPIPFLGQETRAHPCTHTHSHTHTICQRSLKYDLCLFAIQNSNQNKPHFYYFLMNYILIHLASPTLQNWFHLIYVESAFHLWQKPIP